MIHPDDKFRLGSDLTQKIELEKEVETLRAENKKLRERIEQIEKQWKDAVYPRWYEDRGSGVMG